MEIFVKPSQALDLFSLSKLYFGQPKIRRKTYLSEKCHFIPLWADSGGVRDGWVCFSGHRSVNCAKTGFGFMHDHVHRVSRAEFGTLESAIFSPHATFDACHFRRITLLCNNDRFTYLFRQILCSALIRKRGNAFGTISVNTSLFVLAKLALYGDRCPIATLLLDDN